MSFVDLLLRRIFATLCLSGATCLLVPMSRAGSCDPGLELSLSGQEPGQGSLLLVELRSAKPILKISGKWNDREVLFWKQDEGPAGEHTRWALIGVDLEKPAAAYPFSVDALVAQAPSGERASCTQTIEVKEGHFATENLTVKKQFVEPNPEQLARAEAEAKRLREIYDHVTPERLWDGKFRLPLEGEFKGTNFGKRRVLNGKAGSPHGGVDFPAPTGTPVHAAQSGRVVLAEELYFAGNAVVVDHGLGIYTFYCHFSEIDAKVGDAVRVGTVLGKVGATGRVTGPHLHWGLSVERARVNALDIVKLLGSK